MKFIEWNENLRVNIEEIDNQHRNIIKFIDILHEKLRKGEGITVIKPTLNLLIEYIINHFSTEEKWMKKHEYPEFQQHYDEHQKYIASIKSLIIKSEKGTPLLARNLLLSLGGWYREHITEYDKKFGKFLENKTTKTDT